MATLGATASASAAASSVANNAPKSSTYSPLCHRNFYHSQSKVSFRLTPKPKLRFSSKGLQSSWNRSTAARAQLNEVRFFQSFSLEELFSKFCSSVETLLEPSVAFKVAVDGSSNAAAAAPTKSPAETKDAKSSNEPALVATEDKVSAFMSQVAGLVKLVDSKDIMELQFKQLDCELVIRKKEALPPPPTPAPIMTAPAHLPPPAVPSSAPSVPAPAPVATPASPPPARPGPAPVAKSAKSSHPPLKCPMAGTFYRSPAPSEPAFVKVGDKVQKGQVLCIIEAMKLMNEIEADQSGTIVEILAEDGKAVSIDTPLFVIEP